MGRIADLNDRLRQDYRGGDVYLTRRVAGLPSETKVKVLLAVHRFSDFNADNDPYGEHDCAFFDVDGERYFFKIDYYDENKRYASPNPADESVTTRVLTIGHASDY